MEDKTKSGAPDIEGTWVRESPIDLSRLQDVFPPEDIEWRVQNSGVKNDKVWAMVLCYITNRAIMERLDEVCGPENWKNEFTAAPNGGTLCGISIKCGDEWVTKWDGADNTDFEAVKGGLSGAMKRAGVQWGIGRYLYKLDATFADIVAKGKHRDAVKDKQTKKIIQMFQWNDPQLPVWAVPGGTKQQKSPQTHEDAPKTQEANVGDKHAEKATEKQKFAIKKMLTAKGITDELEQCETVSALAGLPEIINRLENLSKSQASIVIEKIQEKS